MESPHPRMVYVWMLKVALIPILFWLPLLVLTVLAVVPLGPEDAGTLFAELFIGIAIVVLAYAWASLFRRYYRWELRDEEVRIWRGILFRKRITIPYIRIQNVNVVRGPLLLLLGLSGVEVETAGQKGIAYGFYLTEGYLPGLVDGDSLADAIIGRVRGAAGSGGL